MKMLKSDIPRQLMSSILLCDTRRFTVLSFQLFNDEFNFA